MRPLIHQALRAGSNFFVASSLDETRHGLERCSRTSSRSSSPPGPRSSPDCECRPRCRLGSNDLRITGLVDNPIELLLRELRGLPHHEQITQHFSIQGLLGVAKWGGVSMQTIIDQVRPKREAKWVVFYSRADGPEKGFYQTIDREDDGAGIPTAISTR